MAALRADEKIAIDIRHIKKSFSHGRYQVFKDVNLQVPKGKITFLLGPSGVGKSVLLKHILGLLKPDAGEVLVGEQQIPYENSRRLAEMRKRFGMLFQNSALFDDMTVGENVEFPLVEHRREMSKEERRARVVEKLKAVGLDPDATIDKRPNELSGGMRKRVGLARAIVLEPEFLLYDEPTTGLDPVTRSMVDDLIIETNEKFHMTTIVISHDIPSALYSADYIAFLADGQIVFHGTPDEFRACKHPIAHGFLESEAKHRKEVYTIEEGEQK